MEEYTNSEQFLANIQQQETDFNDYRTRRKRNQPFHDWDGFLTQYWTVRACLASLALNPDTKDDPDFAALCAHWQAQRLGKFDFETWDTLYYKLYRKPVFHENRIFTKTLRVAFDNSIKKLLNDEHYTKTFFEIE